MYFFFLTETTKSFALSKTKSIKVYVCWGCNSQGRRCLCEYLFELVFFLRFVFDYLKALDTFFVLLDTIVIGTTWQCRAVGGIKHWEKLLPLNRRGLWERGLFPTQILKHFSWNLLLCIWVRINKIFVFMHVFDNYYQRCPVPSEHFSGRVERFVLRQKFALFTQFGQYHVKWNLTNVTKTKLKVILCFICSSLPGYRDASKSQPIRDSPESVEWGRWLYCNI